jgi:nucleotide-binding universal stress UspA family protein
LKVASTPSNANEGIGPVLFAYDGSELATLAIEVGGRQLAAGREVLVLTVWQPVDVGFEPVGPGHLDAQRTTEVKKAAEETAAFGAALAEKAGFRAQSLVAEVSPTWKGLVETAEQHNVSLIVIGSHRRTGLRGHLGGSVAAAVISHSSASVLLVHPPS